MTVGTESNAKPMDVNACISLMSRRGKLVPKLGSFGET